MKFRRSRCTAVTVSVLLLLVMALSVLHSHGKYMEPGQSMFDLGLALFRPKKNAYNFDFWADALYKRYLAQADEKEVHFSQYVLGSKNVHDISTEKITYKMMNSHISVFDPRFTLSVIMADLSRQLTSGVPESQLSLSAFHWADWTDLNVHQQAMVSREPVTCETLRPKGSPQTAIQKDILHNPYAFCYDDTQLGQPVEEKARKSADFTSLDRSQADGALSAGFHVFKYPGRTTQAVKVAASASYLYDFMPTPAGIVILGASTTKKGPFSVFVPCNVTFRQRLVANPLAQVAEKKGTLNLEAEVAKFTSLREKRGKMGDGADEKGENGRGENADTQTSHLLELIHEDFVDNSAQIADQLAQAKLTNSLSASEEKYLEALRMSLSTKDPSKYFHEAKLVRREKNWVLGGHYDWRFFKGLRFNTDVHGPILHGLISAWLRFSHAQKVRTWLAHGTLLGWFWNGASFPWDADIDVQMPIRDLHFLARRFNQSIVVDYGGAPNQELRMGRYFLDIGPWLSHRDPGTGQNSIDARFIDMDSGLYIDITALAVSSVPSPQRYGLITEEDEDIPKKPEEDEENLSPEQQQEKEAKEAEEQAKFEAHTFEQNFGGHVYNCRNKHFSSLSEISPLRETYMEGVPAYVPGKFVQILQTEYGDKSIAQERFKTHVFLRRFRLWVNARLLSKYSREKVTLNVPGAGQPAGAINMGDFLGEQIGEAQKAKEPGMNLSDEDYLQILATEPELLKEYLATREYTGAHEMEMYSVMGQSFVQDSEKMAYFDRLKVPERSMRRDVSGFLRAKNGWNFELAQTKLQQEYEQRGSMQEGISDSNFIPPKNSDSKNSGSNSGAVSFLISDTDSVAITIPVSEQQREKETLDIGGAEAAFQKQSEEDARDPSITRPDQE